MPSKPGGRLGRWLLWNLSAASARRSERAFQSDGHSWGEAMADSGEIPIAALRASPLIAVQACGGLGLKAVVDARKVVPTLAPPRHSGSGLRLARRSCLIEHRQERRRQVGAVQLSLRNEHLDSADKAPPLRGKRALHGLAVARASRSAMPPRRRGVPGPVSLPYAPCRSAPTSWPEARDPSLIARLTVSVSISTLRCSLAT